LIQASPDLEVLAPTSLNIVCFRFRTPNGDGAILNHLNEQIMMELHEQGIAVPTYTMLNGTFALRVAHTNHRTRREDFDLLVREVIRLGKQLSVGG
jgi:glutamate/tyrosine decarboxylase-like PLP-dependent enzyme